MEMNLEMREITDLGLAAALVSNDFALKGINLDAGGRGRFQFLETSELDHAVNAYWDNNLAVQARAYFDNIKMLKGRIYAGK